MTVFELHLEIDQKLQEQGSFQTDRIFPEAIDLALNEAMQELIKDYSEISFGDREKKLKAIEPLMVKNLLLPTIPSLITDTTYEPDAGYLYLPPDFLYGINYRGESVLNTLDCEERPTLQTTTQTEYVATVAFPTTNLTVGPYYNNFRIDRTGPTAVYIAWPGLFDRIMSTDQKYEIVQSVLDTINVPRATGRIYWEYYKDTYARNSFIIVSNTNLATFTISIFNADGTTPDATSAGTQSGTTQTIYNRVPLSSQEGIEITYPELKFLEPDAIYKARRNNFTRSRSNSPHTARSGNYLWIYNGENFIVTAVLLDYIRKPRTISLALNQTCELDPTVHSEVVERAIEILKLNIQDPSAQADIQYNRVTTRN